MDVCGCRYRHVYEFIMLLDADEFVHVLSPARQPQRADILKHLRSEMELRRASGTFHSALYRVHCLSDRCSFSPAFHMIGGDHQYKES